MNNDYKAALSELECLGAVRRVTAMPGWNSFFQGSHVVSDDDLIVLLAKVSSLLRAKKVSEAQTNALMGCLYLTKRISDICARLREDELGNLLEFDLSIALKLPGEAANSLSFNLAGEAFQTDEVAEIERLLAALGSFALGCSSGISSCREQVPDFPLLSLSGIYVMLLDVVQLKNYDH